MWMLLLLILAVIVAYLYMSGSTFGGLFEDCKELKDKYHVPELQDIEV